MELLDITEVCRITGTTSRTLRHYQQIGLLEPTHIGANGIRFYNQVALLKLQHILVLKQLALPLPQIAKVLAGQQNAKTAIDDRLRLVAAEVARLERMQLALELTKEKLENGEPLMAEESFDGFANDPYAEEAQQRWPDTYAESQRRIGKMSARERGDVLESGNQITRELAVLFNAKVAADAPEVQELIRRHYDWVCNFWTPEHDSYIGLGQMYVDDARFTAHYNEFAVGLAPFIRDAILHYASSRLA